MNDEKLDAYLRDPARKKHVIEKHLEKLGSIPSESSSWTQASNLPFKLSYSFDGENKVIFKVEEYDLTLTCIFPIEYPFFPAHVFLSRDVKHPNIENKQYIYGFPGPAFDLRQLLLSMWVVLNEEEKSL